MSDIEIPVEDTGLKGTTHTIDDSKDKPKMSKERLQKLLTLQNLSGFVRDKFFGASNDREVSENIWLQCLDLWRGKHSPNEQKLIAETLKRNPEANSIFIKLTKVKVNAAYGQVLDVLFPAGTEFPLEVTSTPKPEGIAEYMTAFPEGSELPEDLSGIPELDPVGFAGDGNDLEPGATMASRLKGATEKWGALLSGKKLVDGPSPDKNQFTQVNLAKETGANMTKVIWDQLLEQRAEAAMRLVAFECVLYGTGVLKGPLTREETIPYWSQDPITKEITEDFKTKLSPKIEHVTLWDFYPDPEAKNKEDMEWCIQRHKMNRSNLKALGKQPYFMTDVINELVLTQGPGYDIEDFDDDLQDNVTETETNRFEVLEYWGPIDVDMAIALDLNVEGIDDLYEVQVNIWTADDKVIKVVANPFTPNKIPYHIVPYEINPNQLWGIGIAENMRETQELVNTHTRLAVDNLRLAGSVMWEVDHRFLQPGQEMTTFPGKVWGKNGGAPGQSIFAFSAPNVAPAHMQMVQQAMQMADQQTIPSVTHGQTGVAGTGRSASAFSMLLQGAGIQIKNVVKNFDTFMLQPLGEEMFRWNMQFNEENSEIRGDMKVIARGSSSLMQKEVKSQRLMSLVQAASNPLMAPFLNAANVFKEIAKTMDLPAEEFVNDIDIAKQYAEVIKAQGGLQGDINQGASTGPEGPNAGPGGPQGPQPAMGGVNAADPTGTGGGNIGFSQAPASSPTGPL